MALVADGGARPVVLAVGDIPTTGEKAKRRVNVAAVLAFIRRHPPDHAFVEGAHAFRDQGASSGFIYGRAIGALEACVQGLLISMTIVEPAVWKRTHGLIRPKEIDPKDWAKVVKEHSRQRAIQLFPAAADQFARRLDHGRAESCLIAWHGLTLLRQGAIAAE